MHMKDCDYGGSNSSSSSSDFSESDVSYISMASGTPLLDNGYDSMRRRSYSTDSVNKNNSNNNNKNNNNANNNNSNLSINYSYNNDDEISSTNYIGMPNIISSNDMIEVENITMTTASTSTLPNRKMLHEKDEDEVSVGSEFTVEEQILKVVDHVEDEWEELAYDHLVPLEVKLALEHNVFGWSHLTSDILGHLLFTVGAFVLTYTLLGFFLQLSPLLKWIISIFAAASSFRMVRRRRRVWLRAPYGSQRYLEQESARRREIEKIDQSGWITRLRRERKLAKVEKKLAKADSKFQKSHQRRVQKALSLSPPRTRLSTLSDEDTPLKRQHNKNRPSFQTDPVLLMNSVQHDQICFANGLINRVPYSHGGGFGAAPFMLANPHWLAVLRHLMPDVYVEISRRVQVPPHRLIHWAENNPVVAAYNTAHELEYNGNIPNIEWDVFLDPHLVHRVQIVLREQQTFLLSVLPELPTVKPMEKLPEMEQLSPSQRNIIKFYERELRRRVQALVDEMLIAHGNLAQLALEQTGMFKYYNYSRVKRTRRTLGGGIYARQWMAVYAESLRVGIEESPETSPTSAPIPMNKRRSTLEDMATSTCPNMSIAESVDVIKQVVKRDSPFGLYLDVKSRHIPPQVWACVVDLLREFGVRIEGIGAFVQEEIRSIRRHTVQPVKEILFFHSAGDLQQACHDKKIRFGDTVFFNAGSLLVTPATDTSQSGMKSACQRLCGSFDADATKQSYRLQPFALSSRLGERSYNTILGWTGSTIEDYKRRYNLSIGLYVQEFAIDDAAANILVQLVNDYPHIYDQGLSWGGVNGITLRGIRPGRFTDTSGFWNQRYIGAIWDSGRRPPV